MKRLTILIVFGLSNLLLNAQNASINSSNYFEYYNKIEAQKITTNWLTQIEISSIISEELDKYKFKHNYNNVLYEIANKSTIILDVFSRKLNIGFLIQTGHYVIPQKEHRLARNYDSVKYDHNGKMTRFEIDQLPNNIHLLLETNYWYQYSNDKSEVNNAVCREKIIEILKDDIAQILAKYKNLEDSVLEKEWIGVPTDISSLNLKGFVTWAEFLDGQNGIDEYIKKEIKNLRSSISVKKNEELIVEYWINENGNTENIKVSKASSLSIEKEVLRIIERMPSWKPAKHNGEKINSMYEQKIIITKE